MGVESIVIRELLENGVHFGHQTNRWNPKMKKYIFGAKSGIYIIDLQKTEVALANAVRFLQEMGSTGKRVLFVGTKKQAKQTVKDEAQRCGQFFVDERWLGGCLTNFATIRKSVERLNHLQKMKEGEVYETLAKKEKAGIDREEHKLLKNLAGIRDMHELPSCMVVIDAEAENIAIKEAQRVKIPIIALVDTNCNPDVIDFPIPGNDDAIRSIRYIISVLAGAVEKGCQEEAANRPPEKEMSATEQPAEKPATEVDTEDIREEQPKTENPIPEKEPAEDIAPEPKEEEDEEDEDEPLEGDIKLNGSEG